MLPWQNTVWLLMEPPHFPWGCLKGQQNLHGTGGALHLWHGQVKSWCFCSGLHTQAVIPDQFLCKLWAKGKFLLQPLTATWRQSSLCSPPAEDPWDGFSGE